MEVSLFHLFVLSSVWNLYLLSARSVFNFLILINSVCPTLVSGIILRLQPLLVLLFMQVFLQCQALHYCPNRKALQVKFVKELKARTEGSRARADGVAVVNPGACVVGDSELIVRDVSKCVAHT